MLDTNGSAPTASERPELPPPVVVGRSRQTNVSPETRSTGHVDGYEQLFDWLYAVGYPDRRFRHQRHVTRELEVKTVRSTMSEEVMLGLLGRVQLLADLPAADLQKAARVARPLSRKKGARIFEEGSVADSCYFITSGRAKVVLSGMNAVEVTVGTIEPFELVGELSLLDGAPRSAGLVAMQDCHLIQLTKAAFDALRRNEGFEDKLLRHVAKMLRRATEQLRVSYTYSSTERVAWSLARLASRGGRRVGETLIISPRPPHQELADMAGTSRETATRTLLHLKRLRWVTWDAETLRLNERAFKRYLDAEQATTGSVDIARVV
jgi:CRP/FNR family cyclic AMP-dependent transcriptional regulator